MSIDNLEHGWIVSEKYRLAPTAPKRLGRCAWCRENIYEDEDLKTYGYNQHGELLCWYCFEESEDQRLK